MGERGGAGGGGDLQARPVVAACAKLGIKQLITSVAMHNLWRKAAEGCWGGGGGGREGQTCKQN